MKKLINLALPKWVKNAVKSEDFRVVVNENDTEIEILLTGFVGDEWTESDAGSIDRVLSANRGKPVHLKVNSLGGSAFDGLAIHNALGQHDGPTRATVTGVAASAAAIAILGADKIAAYENTTLMIHEGLIGVQGHIAELQNGIVWLEAFNTNAAESLAARTGHSVEDMRTALTGEHGDGTVYTAAEALDAKLIDEVIPLKKGKAKNAAPAAVFDSLRARLRVARLRAS